MKKIFQKELILVFEVIVQPSKTHFWTFSSETKIIKITHSDYEMSRHLKHYNLISTLFKHSFALHSNQNAAECTIIIGITLYDKITKKFPVQVLLISSYIL